MSSKSEEKLERDINESEESRPQYVYDAEWYDASFQFDDFADENWYEQGDDYDPEQSGQQYSNMFGSSSETDESQSSTQFDNRYFRPIRIKLDTSSLPSDDFHQDKNKFIETMVMPAAVQFWTKTLMLYPVKKLFIDNSYCNIASLADSWNGITGVDLMIYVSAEKYCENLATNHGDKEQQPIRILDTIAASESCDWDQYDRPIGGIIDFCYNSFLLNEDGSASSETTRTMIDVAIHELGHILGLRSKDLAFYYDHETGQPRTPRPIQPKYDTVCVTGETVGERLQQTKEEVYTPATNTLHMDHIFPGISFYEVVTPMVRNVARNHYNCQNMKGMRLENQPTNGDCFGDHWEERIAWDASMSATTPFNPNAAVNEYLSPFTLALLQDSGWYLANFTMTMDFGFGKGAGCDFVNKPCLVDNGQLPDYSRGYFCNNTRRDIDYGCDPSHTVVSTCDLRDLSKVPGEPFPPVPYNFRYFPSHVERNDLPSALWGPKRFKLADFCPMFVDPIFSCKGPLGSALIQKGTMEIYPFESFGHDNSRCFMSNYERPLCLIARCDEKENAVLVRVSSDKQPGIIQEVKCTKDGEKIEIDHFIDDRVRESKAGVNQTNALTPKLYIECPRLTAICPQLGCPGGCGGRGKCVWDAEPSPFCQCFDPEETSTNCVTYKVNVSSIPLQSKDFAHQSKGSTLEKNTETDENSHPSSEKDKNSSLSSSYLHTSLLGLMFALLIVFII